MHPADMPRHPHLRSALLYAGLVLLVAIVGFIEYRHEMGESELKGGVCLAPDSQAAETKSLLLQHLLHSH